MIHGFHMAKEKAIIGPRHSTARGGDRKCSMHHEDVAMNDEKQHWMFVAPEYITYRIVAPRQGQVPK